jgi:hypothetical protein
MNKVEKARELIEKYGFSRNSYKTGEQYEKTYIDKETRYSWWFKKVIVTIELYTDEDGAYAGANITSVDGWGDLTDLKTVQDYIEQAVADIEELQDEIDDLEGDEEELEQNE